MFIQKSIMILRQLHKYSVLKIMIIWENIYHYHMEPSFQKVCFQQQKTGWKKQLTDSILRVWNWFDIFARISNWPSSNFWRIDQKILDTHYLPVKIYVFHTIIIGVKIMSNTNNQHWYSFIDILAFWLFFFFIYFNNLSFKP